MLEPSFCGLALLTAGAQRNQFKRARNCELARTRDGSDWRASSDGFWAPMGAGGLSTVSKPRAGRVLLEAGERGHAAHAPIT